MIDVLGSFENLGVGAVLGLGAFVGFTRASLREIRSSLARIEKHNELQNGRLSTLEVQCSKTEAILPVLAAAVATAGRPPGGPPVPILRG